MFEFLIRDFTLYDQPGDDIPLRVVGLKGLLEEVSRAIEDDKVCIAVYEIHELVVDLSVPRKATVTKGDECPRCGEDDIDNLVWTHGEYVSYVLCQSCGVIYVPHKIAN